MRNLTPIAQKTAGPVGGLDVFRLNLSAAFALERKKGDIAERIGRALSKRDPMALNDCALNWPASAEPIACRRPTST